MHPISKICPVNPYLDGTVRCLLAHLRHATLLMFYFPMS